MPGDYIRGENTNSHVRVSALKRVQYIGRGLAIAVLNNSSKDALSHILSVKSVVSNFDHGSHNELERAG